MLLNINQQSLHIDIADADTPLLWILRDQLNLTGTKYGCGIGLCGSCTVLIDGSAIQSCLITAKQLEGKKITTIEGLSSSNSHPVQQAWEELQVAQCGYCQSGQILTAVSLLSHNKQPDDETIKDVMSDVICRCGTYPRILKAVKLASKKLVNK